MGIRINKVTPPCYKCEKRQVGCHSQCEDYKAYKDFLNLQTGEKNTYKTQEQYESYLAFLEKRRNAMRRLL